MKGAVIVAAGMSSRMGEFKPLLKIGTISIVERIISTLQSSGVEMIVVVTGNQAKLLETKLKKYGVVFLRNENYMHSQMFDSAKIGLSYLADHCEQILFTPVDIPLFTKETIIKLCESKSMITYASHQSKKGHPILLNRKIIPDVLAYNGENGLKGALSNIKDCLIIEVDDEGILYDTDTPEDYQKLLQIHNKQMYRPDVELAICKEEKFMNRQTAQLMYLVEITGSVREACEKMNLSYSKGWHVIRCLEEQLNEKIVIRQQGGSQGGQAYLSDKGKWLLAQYRLFEKDLTKIAQEMFEKYFFEL